MNFAFRTLHHPATTQLLRCQARAKLARIAHSFRNPRRQILSVVAIVLGFIWVSQAIAGVLFREAADPEKLRMWLPLGLFAYTAWHLVKTVTRKQEEPFEWTPAEKELVLAAPITRTQLISYRMATILSSAAIKALIFSAVMIPDLNIWFAGLLGMFLGLILVDLLRVSFELVFHALTKAGQWAFRVLVVGAVASCALWALVKCLTGPEAASDIASPGALIFFQRFAGEIIGLASTSVGAIALLPFKPFCELILANAISPEVFGWGTLSLLMIIGAAAAVYRIDVWMNLRTLIKERAGYQCGLENRHVKGLQSIKRDTRVRVPWQLAGIGSLAWRQLLGAWHYRMTVAVSLGVPILLSCIPLMANHSPFLMLLNIVGGIVFYSFLLLPSALILDFRRDVNRIVVLKSLPIGPVATTIGQLAAPVLICSAFQWTVLAIATLSGSVIGWQAFVAALLLLPVNTLIFGMENFIFLLSPYRRNQEGLDVFLRTILTFTAKGILFAIGLIVAIAWAFAAKMIGASLGTSPLVASVIFSVGAWLMTFGLATGFVYGIVRIYDRFDPSQDAPAVS